MGGSALFASRFRECAARALLLPRRHPGKRSPLWHQRQRAAQLLDVARKYPDFPIVLETVRECLQDVYDVPTLTELMGRIAQRRVRLVEVETADAVAVRGVAAVRLRRGVHVRGRQPAGRAPRRGAVAGQHAAGRAAGPRRAARAARPRGHRRHRAPAAAPDSPTARPATPKAWPTCCGCSGPLTEDEIAERCTAADVGGWLEGLRAAKRALHGVVRRARPGGWPIEDIGRLRDGVGVAVPVGVPASFTEAVADPLGELLGRYARTHGPFTTAEAAARFGLGLRVAADVLGRMARRRQAGARRVHRRTGTDHRRGGEQWCDAEVLQILRRRSLAALRAQVEPVSTAAYARFLPAWQQVGAERASGIDGLAAVIDQLAGVPMPASAVEPLVFAPAGARLPARDARRTAGVR